MVNLGFLWVAIGGAVGSVLRYSMIRVFKPLLGNDGFWAVLFINALGGLFIALVYHMLKSWEMGANLGGGEAWRLLLITGLLGGFTTFSAYTLDGWLLWQEGRIMTALIYVIGSVVAAFLAFGLGMKLARLIGWA